MLQAKYLLVTAALLCGVCALLMSAVIQQTESALSDSERYDIAWSSATARQELSSLGRYLASYAAFEDPDDLQKVALFYEIVEGRIRHFQSGSIGAFMSASAERQARIAQLEDMITTIGSDLESLDDEASFRRAVERVEDALLVLDRIKNEAQVAIAEDAAALSAEIARKQSTLNILLGGLLASCLLLMIMLAKQNRLLKRASDAFERSGERFAHLARHDQLTGLPNRSAMKEALGQLATEPVRGERIGMLVIDLDGFKPINDTLGHLIGDELLVEAASRIREATADSKGSLVSRFGGDEFVVLLRRLVTQEQALECARDILAALRKPHEVRSHSLMVDACIGLAIGSLEGTEPVELLRHADIALNEAKRVGRGSITVFDNAMLEKQAERARVEQELTLALADHQIVPYYQPQVDLATGGIIGFEALARWHHPTRGVIAPASFIEVAEMSGQIVDLGRSMLEQACRDLSQLPVHIDLSVNVSAAQLFQDNFPDFVHDVLRRTGIVPGRLRLEITETALLSDATKAREAIGELRVLGVLISLDDFGTGYASLSYLREFGFDELKIDRSFLRAMQSDLKSLSLIQTILDLGRRLDVSVVPEGIETEEQAALLRSMGCRRGQGYLFGKPAPFDVTLGKFSSIEPGGRYLSDYAVKGAGGDICAGFPQGLAVGELAAGSLS